MSNVKLKHKIFLWVAKYLPVIIAINFLINNTLATFDINVFINDIFDYLFGASITSIFLMYVCSYAFQFCTWHRIIITYDLCAILFTYVIKYTYIGLYTDVTLLSFHYVLALPFIIFAYISFHKNKTLK